MVYEKGENYIGRDYKIYVHVNKINGKVYIGQTCQDIKRRFGTNGMYYKNSVYFYKAIQKYGWDNFKHIVLIERLTQQESNILEEYLICKYQSNNSKFGYNLKSGGLNNTQHKFTKLKISKSHKGKFCGDENGRSKRVYQYEIQSRRLVNVFESIQLAGKEFGSTGGISDCCNNKSFKAYGYVWCFEGESPNFNIYDKRNKRAKVVIQYNLDGEFIAEYSSTFKAEKETGISRSSICRCCKGEQITGSGYLWEYKEVI